jgi:hypothetical protein
MDARCYELIEAFGVQKLDGGSLIFPPSEVRVRASSRGCSMAVGNHEPFWVHAKEIDRLVAEGVAVPR